MMHQFNVLTTRDQWLPYKAAWQEIVEENGDDNPFLEFDLLDTWWDVICEDPIEIHVCTIDGVVKGFLPLSVIEHTRGKKYTFIGEKDLNYMDFIVRNEDKALIVPAFLQQLLDTDEPVMLELRGVEECSLTNDMLEHACTKNQYTYNFTRTVAPYTSLKEIPQENYEPLHKSSLKKYIKRLNKVGHINFRQATNEDMPHIFELFDKRWQKKMDTSGFTSPQKRAFFTAMLAYDITKVEVLELDDTLLGFTYCFEKGDRFVCYLHSFDEDYRRFGAGNLLDYYMTLNCYARGIDILDFSIGYEDYKYRWATHTSFVRTYYIANAAGRKMWQRQLFVGKCIELTKKYPKAVHFRRNTVGKAKYWLENYRELPHYTQQNIFSKEVDIYRLKARTLRPVKTAQLLNYQMLQNDLSAAEIDLLYRKYDFYKIGQHIVHVNEKTCKEDDWHYTIALRNNERYIPNFTWSYAEEIARNFNDKTIYTKVDRTDESMQNILKGLGFEYVTTIDISRFFKNKKMHSDDFEELGSTKVRLTK